MYEYDLRSGRDFPEFDFPTNQDNDAVVNFLNWDTFFYTRQFYSMDTEFHLAAVTKMLSYPITIASVLHQYSPYSLKPKGPLTLEGLKSLAALRYTLFPTDRTQPWQDRPMRFFVLGARAESQLPPHVWKQLAVLFPDASFEIVFIGPECNFDRNKRRYVSSQRRIVKRFDKQMSFTYCTDYFHVLNDAQDFMPYDPYMDCFFLFHPGLGAPEAMDQWEKTIPGLLESKCPVFVTGFHQQDNLRDWNWLHSKFANHLDVILEPRENIFGSTKWEINDLDPAEVYQFNQQLFGFRALGVWGRAPRNLFGLGFAGGQPPCTPVALRGFIEYNPTLGEEWKTAFTTPFGQFQYNVLLLGLSGAPATFQKFMYGIFADMYFVTVVVYLDVILIFSESNEDHLREGFRRLMNHGLIVNLEKCEFEKISLDNWAITLIAAGRLECRMSNNRHS
ncbi:hypothetical protein TRICI_005118 [Trichomonascus ciferrii]|uniref:Uncharacterized protein n=1 Tax=Trichomonascus ciferrii TaxID=44093 RepID=A0A642V2R2_9ASCO|nr:hypothetical protein TRICI_005118 [Trichomonascus ciferrii]